MSGGKVSHSKGVSHFDSITRVAIEELVREHGSQSKYGLFFDESAIKTLVGEVARLFMASRNLKDRGDKILARGAVKEL